MANHSCGRNRRMVPAHTAASEPAMRRWPHPVDGTEPMQCPDPSLQYIRCALSYQNQLLAEIRSLLEQMAASAPEKYRLGRYFPGAAEREVLLAFFPLEPYNKR